jgi:hypothetical protein
MLLLSKEHNFVNRLILISLRSSISCVESFELKAFNTKSKGKITKKYQKIATLGRVTIDSTNELPSQTRKPES